MTRVARLHEGGWRSPLERMITEHATLEEIMSHSLDEHHARAADHYDSAAAHHRAAERAYRAGDHQTAAYEAQLALGHAVQAHDHADLAAMAQLEHHGELEHMAGKRHEM
jgi:hypothetical protein